MTALTAFVQWAVFAWVAQMMGIEIFIAARDVRYAIKDMRSQRVLRRV
jgi:hypothetical protein